MERHLAQLTGQFLIDREGVLRWSNIECAREGLAGIERVPSDEEVLAATRLLEALACEISRQPRGPGVTRATSTGS